MVKFRNFTPHGITILAPRGETLYLPSEGCARAAQIREALPKKRR